jgi:hypothetical protein
MEEFIPLLWSIYSQSLNVRYELILKAAANGCSILKGDSGKTMKSNYERIGKIRLL